MSQTGEVRGVLAAARSHARTLRELARSELGVRVYSGSLAGEGTAPLSILYSGRLAYARDFELYVAAPRAPAPSMQEPLRGGLGRYLLRGAAEAARWSGADLHVRELLPWMQPAPDEIVHVPFVDGALRVAATIEAQIQLVRSKAHRRRLRASLRRPRGGATTRSDLGALELFYRRLYEPYVRSRFRERGHLDSLESLARLHQEKNGRVLLLAEDGEPVSGAFLFEAARGVLAYHRNGFGGAELSPVSFARRTAALEIALFNYALASGARTIDFGYTRAVLGDGVLTHKRRLGCTFRALAAAPPFGLRIRPGLRPRVLSRFPCVAHHQGGLRAEVGFDASTPPLPLRQWRSVLKNYRLPSLIAVRVITDAPQGHQGRALFEAAFREVLGAIPLTVEVER